MPQLVINGVTSSIDLMTAYSKVTADLDENLHHANNGTWAFL